MGHDLRSLVVTSDSRHWLEFGAALTGGSLFLDDEVKESVFEPVTDRTTKIGEQIGAAGWQFGVPTAAYLVARATGHEGVADLSIAIVRTQMVNAIVTRGLKFLPRARPYETTATPAKGSFPSGHASAAFATATVLQRKWGWKAGVPSYVVATFVGATRLENAHFLSDVTFGAALGVASGLAIKLPGAHHTIEPLVAPGKVGLAITLGGPRS
jgi:membrane-associated phospholipid phosphatase